MTAKLKHELCARRIREALDDQGMRAAELAERSGVASSSISQYLTGRNIPGNISAQKLGAVLNVNFLWLMELSDDKQPDVRTSIQMDDALARKALALYNDPEARILLDVKEKLNAEELNALLLFAKSLMEKKK